MKEIYLPHIIYKRMPCFCIITGLVSLFALGYPGILFGGSLTIYGSVIKLVRG